MKKIIIPLILILFLSSCFGSLEDNSFVNNRTFDSAMSNINYRFDSIDKELIGIRGDLDTIKYNQRILLENQEILQQNQDTLKKGLFLIYAKVANENRFSLRNLIKNW